MVTVIATEDGSISSDATAAAREIKFKKGGEISLIDHQAEFLVDCGKAKYKESSKKVDAKANTNKKTSSKDKEEK